MDRSQVQARTISDTVCHPNPVCLHHAGFFILASMCKHNFTAQQINSNFSPASMPGEAWAEVPDTDGVLAVSSYGRFKVFRGNAGAIREKILKLQTGKFGQRKFAIRINGKMKEFNAPRIVYKAFSKHGISEDKIITFKNLDQSDCRFSNLVQMGWSEKNKISYELHIPIQNALQKCRDQSVVRAKILRSQLAGGDDSMICTHCMNDLPLSLFGMRGAWVRVVCKKCISQITMSYAKKRLASSVGV